MAFEGFSKETLEFLFENRLHNSREWFHEHHTEYENYVVNPLKELVMALSDTMLFIDPQFTVIPQVNKTISRINRDTRFSKDKSLYRDHMWLVFMRNKRFWQGLPQMYFSIGQNGYSYGVGYYEAPAELMATFRQMILSDHPAFLQFKSFYEGQKKYTLEGRNYKRSKYLGESEEKRRYLDMRDFSLNYESAKFDKLLSKRILTELKKSFTELKNPYDFIMEVEEIRKRN